MWAVITLPVFSGEGNGGVLLPELHLGRDAPLAAALVLCFLDKAEVRWRGAWVDSGLHWWILVCQGCQGRSASIPHCEAQGQCSRTLGPHSAAHDRRVPHARRATQHGRWSAHRYQGNCGVCRVAVVVLTALLF
jgi:hypothetical protein